MSYTNATLLHTAVMTDNIEAAELLLKEGIDYTYSKDDRGMTPFHILMRKRIQMIHCKYRDLREEFIHSDYWTEYSTSNFEKNEKFIELLLKHASIDPNGTEDKWMVMFHAACTLKNCAIAESLLGKIVDVNQCISKKSPILPGYTGLHFAAYCNIELAKMLVKKGANLLACDAKGVSPLDICTKSFSLEEVRSILSNVTAWQNILFSNGKTKLMDYVSVLHSSNLHARFLQSVEKTAKIFLPKTSPLWPGYTILHIAVYLLPESYLQMISNILTINSDLVMMQDIYGSTPIHLAYRQNKSNILASLLNHHRTRGNCLDEDNLSHLHIACTVNDVNLVRELLSVESSVDIVYNGKSLLNIKSGWTPLHNACYANNATVAKMLLDAGANLLQTDAEGFTPIHLILINTVTMGNKSSSLIYRDAVDTIKVFSDRGINISPLSKVPTVVRDVAPLLKLLVSQLWADKKLQEDLKNETGLTMLHIVCHVLDLDKIRNLLEKNVDVNAKLPNDYPIWPGFTPLHVLTSILEHPEKIRAKVEISLNLLLDKHADVTLADANGDTPLHLALKSCCEDQGRFRANSLINHHRDFSVNPTNKDGLSHFQIACLLCNLTAVKGFLQHGADVNQSVNESAREFAGKTPLHLALDILAKPLFGAELQLQTVDLLLEYGANVDAVDARGWTLLHNVAMCGPMGLKLLDRIVRIDTDMNKETIDGETPFEILIRCGASIKQIQYFIDHGSRVNAYNRINNRGYMALIIANAGYDYTTLNGILDLMISLPDVAEEDERGRNAIYNTFCGFEMHMNANNFAALIEKLIKLGCHLNQQDREGKTPLHVAVELRDEKAVEVLLRCGADINLVDLAGRSPVCYCIEPTSYHDEEHMYDSLNTALIIYLRKLKMVGLDVSQLNFRLMTASLTLDLSGAEEEALRIQVEKTKNVKIGGLRLYDFVFEKNVLRIISMSTLAERDILGRVLDTIDYRIFGSLRHLLKVQYRKVFERSSLIPLAATSLNILFGSVFDDLCIDIIFKHLSNTELKCLIFSTIEK